MFNSGIKILSTNLLNIYFELATHLTKLTTLWALHISTRDTVKQSRKIIYTHISGDKDGKSIKLQAHSQIMVKCFKQC
jgi:hypothetical protein